MQLENILVGDDDCTPIIADWTTARILTPAPGSVASSAFEEVRAMRGSRPYIPATSRLNGCFKVCPTNDVYAASIVAVQLILPEGPLVSSGVGISGPPAEHSPELMGIQVFGNILPQINGLGVGESKAAMDWDHELTWRQWWDFGDQTTTGVHIVSRVVAELQAAGPLKKLNPGAAETFPRVHEVFTAGTRSEALAKDLLRLLVVRGCHLKEEPRRCALGMMISAATELLASCDDDKTV